MATNSKLCQIQIFQKGRVVLHSKNPLVDQLHSEKLCFGHYQLYLHLLSPMIIQQNNRRKSKRSARRQMSRGKVCLLVLLLLLLLCGDIHPNPGPGNGPKRSPKFPCTVCGRARRGVRSNSKAISCANCGQWTHIKCCDLSDDDYSALLSLSSTFPIFVMAACKLNCPTI